MPKVELKSTPWALALVHALEAVVNALAMEQAAHCLGMHAAQELLRAKRHLPAAAAVTADLVPVYTASSNRIVDLRLASMQADIDCAHEVQTSDRPG